MQLILNGDTRPIPFFVAQSADHVSGLTGAAPSVTLSKNGASFAAAGGSVGEIGNGWYRLTPSTADTGSNGPLLLHATATGGDPADLSAQVVAFSPYDSAALGLSRLDASVTSRMASFTLPANFATLAIDGGGAVTASNLTTLLDATLSGHNSAGTAGAALNQLIGALTESYAANGAPATLTQLLYGMFAVLTNVTQTGATITAARLDGATPAMSFTLDSASAPTYRRRAS